MTDLEILESLPSLYPLKDYEEEAVLNVCKMFEDIKAEIEKERIKAIYRDYGPKIFIEIGEGNTLSVPSSKGSYLYNWDSSGTLNFYGCDYDNQFTAPANFPMTISADGNTLTIGAYHSGEEFGYGIYRPSVFLDDYKLKACATSDIVLTRKK